MSAAWEAPRPAPCEKIKPERWTIGLPTKKVTLDLIRWTVNEAGTLLVWELNSEGVPELTQGWSQRYWLTINRAGW